MASQVCFENNGLALPWIQEEVDVKQVAAAVARSSITKLATTPDLAWAVPLGNHIPRFMILTMF
jgi:hypothetical protein